MVAPRYAVRPARAVPTFVVQITHGGDAAELTRVFTSGHKARARAVRCADILRGRAWRQRCEVRVVYVSPEEHQVVFRVPVWVPMCGRAAG
jgi:hypothetical protein